MDLGTRMKHYEVSEQRLLPPRQPTIIRLDIRAGHTLTKYMDRPFDRLFQDLMEGTMRVLVEDCQTCVHGYTQSDEISLVLHPYRSHNTEAWFGGNVQKMVSISAAHASATASLFLHRIVQFDSRVFTLPEDEVLNYLIWRQLDARRNSVQMLARSLYSHKELISKKEDDLYDLIRAKGFEWTDLPLRSRYGISIARNSDRKWELVYPNYRQLTDTDYIAKMFERTVE